MQSTDKYFNLSSPTVSKTADELKVADSGWLETLYQFMVHMSDDDILGLLKAYNRQQHKYKGTLYHSDYPRLAAFF